MQCISSAIHIPNHGPASNVLCLVEGEDFAWKSEAQSRVRCENFYLRYDARWKVVMALRTEQGPRGCRLKVNLIYETLFRHSCRC